MNINFSLRDPTNDLAQIFNDADIFLLTSGWEGFGNVVVEAMYYGVTPVVVNCRGGPKEIVNDHYGYIAKRSPVDIAEKMEMAVEYPISQKLLFTRSQEFQSERIASQYIQGLSQDHQSLI